jgi:hypothetical protein
MSAQDPKKAPVVVVVSGPDPSGTFSAGPVSGVLPLVTRQTRGATREEALDALKAGLARLGYHAEPAVHDDLEAAQAEVRRRRIATELLAEISPARGRLADVLPERPDLLEALDAVAGALSAAACGELREEPPIEDGRLVCPDCSNGRKEYGFEATADALVTVRFDQSGQTTDVAGVDKQVDPRGYRPPPTLEGRRGPADPRGRPPGPPRPGFPIPFFPPHPRERPRTPARLSGVRVRRAGTQDNPDPPEEAPHPCKP